jgi:nucleoside phosphorylase
MAGRRLRHEDYTVGWVCALPIELAAAQEMLDEEHEKLHHDAHDTNIYTLGRISKHNVVIACLPEGQTGNNSAAAVALQMKSTFPLIRFGLIVGIGGGVPSDEADIRLGDVVISRPHKLHGGVVQYDCGKATPSGFERTGSLNTPPTILLNAIANLRANHVRGRYRLPEYLCKLHSLPIFARENAGSDILFEANYNHQGGATCGQCNKERVVIRQPRTQEILIHYGIIASGNQVMRDAAERDRVSAELGSVLCFEMEAAGLMNNFPCLVIRGICDYADSHKNKRWQPYAAGTAAACAKEVLSNIPTAEVAKSRTADEIISYTSSATTQQSESQSPASPRLGSKGPYEAAETSELIFSYAAEILNMVNPCHLLAGYLLGFFFSVIFLVVFYYCEESLRLMMMN